MKTNASNRSTPANASALISFRILLIHYICHGILAISSLTVLYIFYILVHSATSERLI